MYTERIGAMPQEVAREFHKRKSWQTLACQSLSIGSVVALMAAAGAAACLGFGAAVDYVFYDFLDWQRCSCCVPFNLSQAFETIVFLTAAGFVLGSGWASFFGYLERGRVRADLASAQVRKYKLELSNEHAIVFIDCYDEKLVCVVFSNGAGNTSVVPLKDPEFLNDGVATVWEWTETIHTQMVFNKALSGSVIQASSFVVTCSSKFAALIFEGFQSSNEGGQNVGRLEIERPFSEVIAMLKAEAIDPPKRRPAANQRLAGLLNRP